MLYVQREVGREAVHEGGSLQRESLHWILLTEVCCVTYFAGGRLYRENVGAVACPHRASLCFKKNVRIFVLELRECGDGCEI